MRFFERSYVFIFWAIVAIAASVGAWFVVTGHEDVEIDTPEPINSNGEDIPPVIVNQPLITEVTAEGAVTWTLYADRAVRDEDSTMMLSKPEIGYNFESGEELDVTSETGWNQIDLSHLDPWGRGARSLYLEMETRLYAGTCPSGATETAYFRIQPIGEAANARLQASNSADPIAGELFVQYVWLPIRDNNIIEYNFHGLDCQDARAYINLRIKGFSN